MNYAAVKAVNIITGLALQYMCCYPITSDLQVLVASLLTFRFVSGAVISFLLLSFL